MDEVGFGESSRGADLHAKTGVFVTSAEQVNEIPVPNGRVPYCSINQVNSMKVGISTLAVVRSVAARGRFSSQDRKDENKIS